MKLEIPIIVGFDDMESLLDDLKKLQTYKLFEGDEMVLVDIEDVAKVLMNHVKAKKSVKGDMISRADAVDAISKIKRTDNWQAAVSMVLLGLPSAEPERKKGKWIYNSPVTMKCDQCGLVIKDWDWNRFKYCPNCCSDMRGERE